MYTLVFLIHEYLLRLKYSSNENANVNDIWLLSSRSSKSTGPNWKDLKHTMIMLLREYFSPFFLLSVLELAQLINYLSVSQDDADTKANISALMICCFWRDLQFLPTNNAHLISQQAWKLSKQQSSTFKSKPEKWCNFFKVTQL